MMDKRLLDCAATRVTSIYGYCIRKLQAEIEAEGLVGKEKGVSEDHDLPKMLILRLDVNRGSEAFWWYHRPQGVPFPHPC